MMASENYETGKYNQHIALFDSAYRQYANAVTRTRTHTGAGKTFLF